MSPMIPILPVVLAAAVATADPTLAQVRWRTDLEAACAEAAGPKRLVLVAIDEPGEAGSEALRAAVWEHPRFAQSLRSDVIPVRVCVGDGDPTRALPGCDAEMVRRDGLRACRVLFGPGATISTPQILLLSSEAGVLWHHIHVADLARVLRGIDGGRQDAARQGQSLANWVRARVLAHARRAQQDGVEYQKLCALTRAANPRHFAMIFEALAKDPPLVQRLLGGWFPAQSSQRARALVATMEQQRSCRVFATLARELEAAGHEVTPDQATREIHGSLPEVRPGFDLGRARFLDGTVRQLADLRGRPAVLFFLLPGAPSLGRELDALLPLIRELQAQGVACLALFASVDEAADRDRVAALGLPCPSGTYDFSKSDPLAGVAWFPGVLVLDEAARVVLADDGAGTRSYTAFAPTARGLARYLAVRPVLAARATATSPSR